jgi:5-methylcytosine-specific restriction endonuclease McrA
MATIKEKLYWKEWQRAFRKTEKYKMWRTKTVEKQNRDRKTMRAQIVEHYGGKCTCCGIKEIPFLTIDHINNDGYKTRKAGNKRREYSLGYYKRIIREGYPADLQILCFNCNLAKNHNGGICPHSTFIKAN